MNLLIFLLAYMVRRKLDRRDRLNADRFWRWLFHRFRRTPAGDSQRVWPGLMLIAVAPALLLLMEAGLAAAGWRAAAYPVEFAVLVLALGAPGWQQVFAAYTRAWRRGDMQGAWYSAKASLSPEARGAAATPESVHVKFAGRFMVNVFERYFLIVFWYAIGGIAAALLARSVIALRDHWPRKAARTRYARMAALVSWLPARLLVLTFGLAGDLAGWSKQGRRHLLSAAVNVETVLVHSADSALTGYALSPGKFASLHPDEWLDFGRRSLQAVRDLLNRSMLVWVCGFALLVIAGIL
ncbi:histidine kinase [Marinobacter sp. X15-166B]|uniref:histidine kinase n=1 Tax=Marinobacter sp. X15-166B TaxID=1897620 RepID=UPI00085C459C|nr:histidine kinase [Marinobacter sp. X15-166B]OEY67789.1 histidine kinase [Marinobacter sp. X15-166B]